MTDPSIEKDPSSEGKKSLQIEAPSMNNAIIDEKTSSEMKECRHCRVKIPQKATVCHFCLKHQSIFRYLILDWAPLATLFLVFIAGFQVYISVLQMQEAKKKRIEAEEVLNKVEDVKTRADQILADTESKVDLLGQNIKKVNEQMNKVNLRLEETEKDFNTKQIKLAGRIDKFRSEAEYKINNAALEVKNQVKNSNQRIKETEKAFKEKNQELSAELEELKNAMSHELGELKWRNELMILADEAKLGSRQAYNRLKDLTAVYSKPDRAKIVTAQIMEVKFAYVGKSRVKGVEIKVKGKKIVLDEQKTQKIIYEFKNNPKWSVRAKLARYLRERKEKGVPEALIYAMENDDHLEVIKQSIESFEHITGYDNPDAIEYGKLLEWWQENRMEVEKKLKEPET